MLHPKNVLIYNTYLKIKTQSQNNQKHKNKQHLVRFSIVSTQLKHLVRKGKTCVITHTRMHTPHTTSVYTPLSKHQKKLQALKKITPCSRKKVTTFHVSIIQRTALLLFLEKLNLKMYLLIENVILTL